MWALEPMLRGPGASARVILLLNQNQNGSDMFWDAHAVKSISNLNLGPQITFRNAFNSLSLFKTEMIGIVWMENCGMRQHSLCKCGSNAPAEPSAKICRRYT